MTVHQLRESGVVQAIEWATVILNAFFTVSLIMWSDDVNSPQWRYLFSIPGHQWTWAGIFGTATLLTAYGLWTKRYRTIAAGLAVLSFGCLFVATFYVIAPIFYDGLVTFGWYPWLLTLIPALVGVTINLNPTGDVWLIRRLRDLRGGR